MTDPTPQTMTQADADVVESIRVNALDSLATEDFQECVLNHEQADRCARILATYAALERVTAELDVAEAFHKVAISERNLAWYQRDAALQELAALKADKARMDWLENKAKGWQGVGITREQIDNEDVRLSWIDGIAPRSEWGASVRTAIDTAMEADRG